MMSSQNRQKEFIKESLKELDTQEDIKTVGNFLRKLALVYVFTDPKFLKDYAPIFSRRLKNLIYKPNELFNLTLEDDIIPEINFSDSFESGRFNINNKDPELRERIKKRMIERVRYYVDRVTIYLSKMILYSKTNTDFFKIIKNPLDNTYEYEKMLTDYNKLAFSLKSNCDFENDIDNYISLNTWEYVPYEESGKLYCIPVYYDGFTNPYTGMKFDDKFLENRAKYDTSPDILSKRLQESGLKEEIKESFVDIEKLNQLELYYLVYNKLNQKNIIIPNFLKNLEKDELMEIYKAPEFIAYKDFDENYIADLDLMILRKIPTSEKNYQLFEYNNNIILGNYFDILNYEKDPEYKLPFWEPTVSREELEKMNKSQIVNKLLFSGKLPKENLTNYLQDNFSKRQLINIYFSPRCMPEQGIFCEGGICDTNLNCCIRILPEEYKLSFYGERVYAGTEKPLKEYFEKIKNIIKKEEEYENIEKQEEVDKQRYENLIKNFILDVERKISYGDNKMSNIPMGLNINKTIIKNLSGPVSAYILTPTEESFVSMKAIFNIKTPVIFMLGDVHGSFNGNCQDVIRSRDLQGAVTYNITDPEFLKLLDSLSSEKTPVDFYVEYFSQYYKEEKDFKFFDYSSKLLLDNKDCFYRRKNKKIYEDIEIKYKCPTENMKWHFGDPREIRNIFDLDYQRLSIMASYNINYFISGILDAVEYNLRGLNPTNYQEKREKLLNILGNISEKLKGYDIQKLFAILSDPMKFSPREIVSKLILQEDFSEISVVYKQFKKQNEKLKKLFFRWFEQYVDYINQTVLSQFKPDETNREFVDILVDALSGKIYDVDRLIIIFTNNKSLQAYMINLISLVSDAYIILRMFKVIPTETASLSIMFLGNSHIQNMIYMFVRIMKIYEIQIIQDNNKDRCITFNDNIDLANLIEKYTKIKIPLIS
jgi:hypothetical protein